eukprot:Colp12_sorted_trinity150504_noHs@2228
MGFLEAFLQRQGMQLMQPDADESQDRVSLKDNDVESLCHCPSCCECRSNGQPRKDCPLRCSPSSSALIGLGFRTMSGASLTSLPLMRHALRPAIHHASSSVFSSRGAVYDGVFPDADIVSMDESYAANNHTGSVKESNTLFQLQLDQILNWFSDLNKNERRLAMMALLDSCDRSEQRYVAECLQPVSSSWCPYNCRDLLSWLPQDVVLKILSHLDPISLCNCARVSRSWNHMTRDNLLWKRLCGWKDYMVSSKLAQEQEKRHTYTVNGKSEVQWMRVFAERYRLRRNWTNGYYTVRTFAGHRQGITCVQFDDTHIVSGSSDRTIKVWSTQTNVQCVMTLHGHQFTVRCLHLDGDRLISGSADKTIKVWCLTTWRCVMTLEGHTDTVRCVQALGSTLISGSYDRTLRRWNLESGTCTGTFVGHTAAVLSLQFNTDTVVSGSSDKSIKVWSMETGQCLHTLTGHADAVTCLQFDEQKIISGSLDGTIKFWDMHTLNCLRTLDWVSSEGHTGVVRQLQV